MDPARSKENPQTNGIGGSFFVTALVLTEAQIKIAVMRPDAPKSGQGHRMERPRESRRR